MITLITVFEMPAKAVKQFMTDWKKDKDFQCLTPTIGCLNFIAVELKNHFQRFRGHWLVIDYQYAILSVGSHRSLFHFA